MLETIAIAAQAGLLALIAYNLATGAWGWRNPGRAPAGARDRNFRVVIPAHDEEAVIGGVLADVAAQDYPAHLTQVWVVADRCTDGTAVVAAAAGMHVAERAAGEGGKGAALGWHLRRHPLADDEALVILDADNRVPPELLARFADELDAGHQSLQAYLDTANPDASPLAMASALSYWASNRMVQLARRHLGWSADLGGTGMCFTPAALDAAGGFGDTLTEDADLGARLTEQGKQVVWLHDVRIRDEKPAGIEVAVRQRARWMAGRRAALRRNAVPLLRAAIRHRSLGPIDLIVRLAQPGRSFVALVSAVLLAAAAMSGWDWLLAWPVWAGAVAVQLLAPLAFLARDRVPGRYLVRYPLVTALAVLWLPIQVLSRFTRGWYHTPHRGS